MIQKKIVMIVMLFGVMAVCNVHIVRADFKFITPENNFNFTPNRDFDTKKHCGVDLVHSGIDDSVFATNFGVIEKSVNSYTANTWNSSTQSCSNYATNYVAVKHILTTGKTVWSRYLHIEQENGVTSESQLLILNRAKDIRIVSGERIGYEGNVGCSSNSHLHYEISKDLINGSGALPPCKSAIDPTPDFIANGSAQVLIPYLSSNATPSVSNYEVFGVENHALYGSITLTTDKDTTFNNIGIGGKHGTAGAIDDLFINPSQVFTANTELLLKGNRDNLVVADDYLFYAYSKEFGQGFPIKYSIVSAGSWITDNDSRTIDTKCGATLVKMKNGKPILDSEGKTIPFTEAEKSGYYVGCETESTPVAGYYLTAKLLKGGNADNWAQWYGNNEGKFKVFIHIPKGATANAIYRVYPQGKNPDNSCLDNDTNYPCYSITIDQSRQANRWVQLTLNNDAKTAWEFKAGGYVGVSADSPMSPNDWLGVDAVKFKNAEPTAGKKALLVIRDANASGLNNYKPFFNKEASHITNYLEEMGIIPTIKWAGKVTFEAMKNYDLVLYDDMGWCEDSATLHYNQLTPAFIAYHQTKKPLYFIGDDLAFNCCGYKNSDWFNLIGLTPSGNGQLDNVNPTADLSTLLPANYGIVNSFNYLADIDSTNTQSYATSLLKTSRGYDAVITYKDSYSKVITQLPDVYASGNIIANPDGLSSLKSLFKKSVAYLLK